VSNLTSRSVTDEALTSRVRLYLMVWLCLDIGFHIIGAISVITGLEADAPAEADKMRWIRWSMTVGTVAAWAYVRFGSPRRRMLHVVETGGTILLALGYVKMAGGIPVYGAAFSVLLISLSMVLRSALVPSSMIRTAIVAAIILGSATLVSIMHAKDTPNIVLMWLLATGVAFGVVSVVTSRVIYGLQRRVRDAQRLGQYELKRKIGEGGMGVVYEATHVMLRRPTAVKLLPVDKAGQQTVTRFEREVRQTSRLEHPNSVYIYDYGRTPDGQFYYAMEFLDGLNLAELIEAQGAISPARAHKILIQAARALSEAHDLGLVHRDIKPANIMLTKRGGEPDSVKVLDFGLVKATGDANVTQADAIIGTPKYLSPEAIRRPDDVGSASDIYALGAVGFYLVAGRDVFEGTSAVEVCAQHLTDEPPSPSEVLGGDIDAEFEKLILRCLSKAPDERPQNGGELVDALLALSVEGWTSADAHQWWDSFQRPDAGARIASESARGQLTIDVGARS